MTRKRIAFGLILIAAFCGVALAMRPNATDQSTLTDNESVVQAERVDYEARFRQIGRDLERERERRLELAAEVADLRRQLASASAPRGLAPGDVEEENHAGSSAEEAIEERRPRGLDVEALVAAGFPESEVRAFKQRIDQIELDRLYLRDLAAREGWLDSPRFREEVGDLSLDAKFCNLNQQFKNKPELQAMFRQRFASNTRDHWLERLEGFASCFGADFYGLPRNTGSVTLVREDWQVPDSYPLGDSTVIPMHAGKTLHWRLRD